MSELGDLFAGSKQRKQERHGKWKEQNIRLIRESGLPFRFSSASQETMLFREKRKTKVDFFPSTGRWRVPGYFKTWTGGAEVFIGWYKREVQDA